MLLINIVDQLHFSTQCESGRCAYSGFWQTKVCPSLKFFARGCYLCCLTNPCRRNVPDERPLQPRNASHGGTSLTPRVPAAPCSGVADLVFVRLIIIIIVLL